MYSLRDGQAPATTVHRGDYAPPAFWIDTVDLSFDSSKMRQREKRQKL